MKELKWKKKEQRHEKERKVRVRDEKNIEGREKMETFKRKKRERERIVWKRGD